MPRTAIPDTSGVLHHVMIRGIERRNIFRSNRDREDFIERLAVLCPGTRTICYAWMSPDEVFSKGRQDRKVKARSLLCFWAARELGLSHTALAKALEMSIAGVGFSVDRGESIVKEGNYLLRK